MPIMEVRPKEAIRQNNKRYTIRQVNKRYLMKEPVKRLQVNPASPPNGTQNVRKDDILIRNKQDKSIRQTIAKKQLTIRRRSTALRQANQQVRQSLVKEPITDVQQEDTPSSERNIFNTADIEVQQQIYRQSRNLVLQIAARNEHHQTNRKARAKQKTSSVSEEVAREDAVFLTGPYQSANAPNNMAILFGTTTADSTNPTNATTLSQTTEAMERFKRTRSAQSLQQKNKARQSQPRRNETLSAKANEQRLLTDNKTG